MELGISFLFWAYSAQRVTKRCEGQHMPESSGLPRGYCVHLRCGGAYGQFLGIEAELTSTQVRWGTRTGYMRHSGPLQTM